MMTGPAFHRFRALGTYAVVGCREPSGLDAAREVVDAVIAACDAACSRFRDDSELSRLNRGERPAAISAWLYDAVGVALMAARDTDGLVEPTIGQCLIDLGYDRTFADITPTSPLVVTATHVPAWERVRLTTSQGRRQISLPAGAKLDLGATAKALCADRAAAAAASRTGTGVLVSLGGDIAAAGEAPEGGWVIRVTDRSDSHPSEEVPGQNITIVGGGLATSGTAARRWARAGTVLHHLIDPRTGRPAEEAWRTISVAAPTCVHANVASTAAMIIGADAPEWLHRRGVDARLVAPDGSVSRVGGWPAELAGVRA